MMTTICLDRACALQSFLRAIERDVNNRFQRYKSFD